ncbi:hypothetical protein ETB97_002022 [Aspergillus alliaceus]|uniref:Uncharacterized protein n=1 Tax=Petromyces alliaceus TaxID=209559 RepID=A0A8H6E6M3_PETAA|nr:hypothetical protein ETB97_002022 [Aspergillus burnettii]
MSSMVQYTVLPIEDVLDSGVFLSELPAGTPEGIGSTIGAIKRLVTRELVNPRPVPYILLHNVPPYTIERITDNWQLLGSRVIYLCYNSETRQLIIKFLGYPHEVEAAKLSYIYCRAFDGMGLSDTYESLRAELADNGQVKKEPDDQWVPRPEYVPAGRNVNLPTVTLESGCSTRARPRVQPVCAQCINIKETKNGILIRGPSLLIRSEEFWLREPNGGKSDYVFSHPALEEEADRVWLHKDIWLSGCNEQLREIPREDFEFDEEANE